MTAPVDIAPTQVIRPFSPDPGSLGGATQGGTMATVPIPTPTHLEQLALFRHAVIGDLVVSDLPRGELQTELKRRAQRRYRPPGARASRTYHWKTLQRWLHRARAGLEALQPVSRQRGFCLALDPEARELLLEIRRQHPAVAAELILDRAIHHGVVAPGAVSLPTLRRLYARAGLTRRSVRRDRRRRDRRKWEADRVCRVWHADVCHVWRRHADGRRVKAYVHAILDDHSRYVVGLRACIAETENDLLDLLVETLLQRPAPDVLYVDNGSTYRGELLTLAMARLGVRVVHAEPYDPEARGKMERFFRTMRQRMTDLIDHPIALDELDTALLSWVDVDYHRRKHAGLLGDTPGRRFRAGLATLPPPLAIAKVASALEIRGTAKVRKDLTFSVDGTRYEVSGRHLAGTTVATVLDPFTRSLIRVVHEGKSLAFGVCKPQVNARRGRATATEAPASNRFDRVADILRQAREVTDEA